MCLSNPTPVVVRTVIVGVIDRKPGSHPVFDSMIGADRHCRQGRAVTVLEAIVVMFERIRAGRKEYTGPRPQAERHIRSSAAGGRKLQTIALGEPFAGVESIGLATLSTFQPLFLDSRDDCNRCSMLSIPAPCGDDPVGMDEETLPTLGPSPNIFVHTRLRLARFSTLFSGAQTKFRLSRNERLNGAAMLVREVTMPIRNAPTVSCDNKKFRGIPCSACFLPTFISAIIIQVYVFRHVPLLDRISVSL